jgi:uncharacterized coiled-coil protein SlyX
MPKKNETGRPPFYSEAQVLRAIERVEQAGETPTGTTVKTALCTYENVSKGINPQSLHAEVVRLLEERDRVRIERLVAALPATTVAAAKEMGARLEGALLAQMAEQHDHLRAVAGQKVDDLNEDLSLKRTRIRELFLQVGEQENTIAGLERCKVDLKQKLEAAAHEIASLKNRISSLEQEGDFRTQMLELMRETLSQHPPALPSPDQ